VKNSYRKKKDVKVIDGFELNKELSTNRSKVYSNAEGKAIISHTGTNSALDWINNLYIPFGQYEKTERYKRQEAAQKKVNAVYGKDNVLTTSHSQSGETARILAKKGLSSKSISVNPAIISKKHKGVQIVRSNTDLVSALTPMSRNDVTIKAKTYSPLAEHSPSILSRTDQEFNGGLYLQHRPRGMMFVMEN
jgi:hypothetical protein